MALNVHRQPMLHKGTNFASVATVSIANCEKVALFEAHNVWIRQICILVDFEGIVCWGATFSRKWEFCYNVCNFALNLLFLWRSFFLNSVGGLSYEFCAWITALKKIVVDALEQTLFLILTAWWLGLSSARILLLLLNIHCSIFVELLLWWTTVVRHTMLS